MPVIQGNASVAASAVNDNVLAGSQFEYLPYDAFLEFGMCGDANGADLRVDVYTGQDIVAEGLVPNIQNRVPVYPDDFAVNDVAGAGERLKMRVRNTSAAGARVIQFLIKVTPYGG